jgi:hypothetical protein
VEMASGRPVPCEEFKPGPNGRPSLFVTMGGRFRRGCTAENSWQLYHPKALKPGWAYHSSPRKAEGVPALEWVIGPGFASAKSAFGCGWCDNWEAGS